MILYSEQNVYEAAKDRIRKLFSMGDRLGVCFSGGKDSTALLHLTLEVTSELGIQKLPVIFLDQECEYTYTVEYMRYVMSLPEVEPI
jgi:probable phosphoadenosine phosphosulfate sulfotransferase protein